MTNDELELEVLRLRRAMSEMISGFIQVYSVMIAIRFDRPHDDMDKELAEMASRIQSMLDSLKREKEDG